MLGPARTAAMKFHGGAAALAILVSCSAPPPERDPAGWEDLLANGLAGWTRVALPPGS